MSKTSKSEQSSEIDPQMRAESEALTSLARALAGMGYNPYEGNTVADFTPAQRAAFAGTDAASAAFGMQGGAVSGGPTGATVGSNGIAGFSPQRTVQAEQSNYGSLSNRINNFFRQAATPTPKQEPHRAGGGKK